MKAASSGSRLISFPLRRIRQEGDTTTTATAPTTATATTTLHLSAATAAKPSRQHFKFIIQRLKDEKQHPPPLDPLTFRGTGSRSPTVGILFSSWTGSRVFSCGWKHNKRGFNLCLNLTRLQKVSTCSAEIVSIQHHFSSWLNFFEFLANERKERRCFHEVHLLLIQISKILL